MDSRGMDNIRMGLLLQLEGKDSAALEHFRLAAKSGNAFGGLSYGIGLLKKGQKSGHKWIDRAKEQDDPSAWATRAFHYLEGEYVEKNTVEGLKHLEKAFSLGHNSCAAELSLIYLQGLYGIEQDHLLSEKWARKSLSGWRKYLSKVRMLPLKQVFRETLALGAAKKRITDETLTEYKSGFSKSLKKALGEDSAQ